MKKDKKIQKLTVSDCYSVTPHMQRLVFTVDDITPFTECSAGQYIKLMFTPQGKTDLSLLGEEEKPVLRTYTIRKFSPLHQQITVDFVKHRDLPEKTPISINSGGYGHYFAQHAAIGDTIFMAGPGIIKPINMDADWFLLVADMAAIPALSVEINTLPECAKGYVVLALTSEDDMPEINIPAGMNLKLCIKGEEESLANTVEKLEWLRGRPSVWCACEFNVMKAIRRYISDQHNVERSRCYFSSYWKEGVTEDGHKVLKREDNDAFYR